MHSVIQFERRAFSRWRFWCASAAALLALILCASAAHAAQGTQTNPVAEIVGRDVSVEGPTAPGADNKRAGAGIMIGNGSVVIVHSGQARMALLSGGTVDICGPAKFTMLQSNGAITLAVELGRMRVRLPATATLRLFTPAIVATPLEITGGARDITVGLDQSDSLCVLATSGAIQLEHQFTGEKLIVPQTGEFFLNEGKLLPVVGKAGSCRCAEMESEPLIPAPTQPPDFAKNSAPPAPSSDLQHASALPMNPAPPAAKSVPDASASSSSVEFSIPAHANEAHPVAPAEKNAPAAPVSPPATSAPIYTVVAPPLTFSSKSPMPPPDPPIDTYLLVREAQVQTSWEYKGHVDPPTFADAMQHALGQGTTGVTVPAAEPSKKRGGFWGFWRRLF